MAKILSKILSLPNVLIGNPLLDKIYPNLNFLDSHFRGNDNHKNNTKSITFLLLLSLLFSCSSSKEFSEFNDVSGTLIETGVASWYGPNFDGKQTANGKTFDMYKLTAAHRTLPFGSIVKVINPKNNKSVIVRINDRGPYAKNRIIDLSKKAAEKIGLIEPGSAQVKLFLLNNKIELPRNIKVPHYTVQVGSYKNRSDAIKISSLINNSRVIKSKINNEVYFRVYIGLFSDKSKAKHLQESLQAKGIDGFVKQVEND